MKIIFLDIDGVLNCETAYKEGFCRYLECDGYSYQSFYPKNKNLLNILIKKTGAKIVVSSVWRFRGIKELQKIWKNENMLGKIIDVTPKLPKFENYTLPRGCEIDYWLENKGFSHINWSEEVQKDYMKQSGIDNYLILDDDSDMLYSQRDNFVHVPPSPRNKLGFNEQCLKKSLKILSQDLLELKFKE